MIVKSRAKTPSAKETSKGKKAVPKSNTASSMQLKPIADKQTKVQILKFIANETNLSIKEVQAVFCMANHLAKCHLIKKGSGEFSIPEMAIKVVRKTKPATKQRQGRNPITGENITIAAKPKREVIKVRPLKSLKEVLL